MARRSVRKQPKKMALSQIVFLIVSLLVVLSMALGTVLAVIQPGR